MYYIQNPKREFKESLKAKKENKRNEKDLNPPEGFCITFRIPKGNSKKIWKAKKRKKRNEKNLNRPEIFCITFRIPKGDSKKVWKQRKKEKKWEEFKSTWRILYYIQNPKRRFKEGLKAKKRKKRNEKNLHPPEGFCITFRIPKRNSKEVWKPKRKEKKWEEFISTWRILNYIQNPKREFKEDLIAEKKRNEKNLNPPEGFCITFRIRKWNSKKVWKPKKKRKEKKWEEFKSTWRILYYIQNPKRQFKECFKAKKRKEKKWEEFKCTWRILYYIQNSERELKEYLKAKKKRKEMRRI